MNEEPKEDALTGRNKIMPKTEEPPESLNESEKYSEFRTEFINKAEALGFIKKKTFSTNHVYMVYPKTDVAIFETDPYDLPSSIVMRVNYNADPYSWAEEGCIILPNQMGINEWLTSVIDRSEQKKRSRER